MSRQIENPHVRSVEAIKTKADAIAAIFEYSVCYATSFYFMLRNMRHRRTVYTSPQLVKIQSFFCGPEEPGVFDCEIPE